MSRMMPVGIVGAMLMACLVGGYVVGILSASPRLPTHRGNSQGAGGATTAADAKSPVKAEESSRAQNDAQENTAINRQVKDFTGLLVIANAVSLAVLVWYVYLTKQAADAASEGVKLTRTSLAEAEKKATLEALVLIAGHRAYVRFDGITNISHPDSVGVIHWWLHPKWSNTGSTPTRRLRIFCEHCLCDNPWSEGLVPGEGVMTPSGVIAPGLHIQSGLLIVSGDDLALVQSGNKFLYVWGVARYEDCFPGTPEHVTKFLYQAQVVTGDPRSAYLVQKNMVEITWAILPQHTCMDEDCGFV